MELLIGTTNEGKVSEFRQLLKNFLPYSTKLSSLTQYPLIHDISEDGKSFLENSQIKAQKIFEQHKITTLTDDSGIEIDALNKAPGIYSARYPYMLFGEGATMIKTMQHILQKLTNIPPKQRTARFVCAVTLITKKGNIFSAQGILEGTIAYTIEGTHGFGYDPIFIPNGYHIPVAQLRDEEKNTISHRYKALCNLFQKVTISDL